MNKPVIATYKVGPVTLTVASQMGGGRWHGPAVDIAVAGNGRLTVRHLQELLSSAYKAELEVYRQSEENYFENQQIVLAQGRKV